VFLKFCNVDFNLLKKEDLFTIINNKLKIIITVNASFIIEANTSRKFYNMLKNNSTCFDGQIPCIIARILSGNRKIEKLSGSDIVYDFCKFAKKYRYKIFFLGGSEQSNEIAVKKIRDKYEVVISGFSPVFENYPFSDFFNRSCQEKINEFRPDILFIGFGAPKQEFWADENKEFLSKINVKYVICSGGTFDFLSEKFKRAPVYIQKFGLEIFYRLIQEPNKLRLMRTINSFRFFKYIFCKPDFMKG
jgi:N-acetylglucosaminyldiphosphoundecaprenol N-acetyl-beta-D-mannosaminyltransferase